MNVARCLCLLFVVFSSLVVVMFSCDLLFVVVYCLFVCCLTLLCFIVARSSFLLCVVCLFVDCCVMFVVCGLLLCFV